MTDKVQKIREKVVWLLSNHDSALDYEAAIEDVLNIIDSSQEEPINKDFEIALEKKVREAQDWTYIEEYGGECPLNEEFGAYDLEKFARWGANWQKQKDAKLIIIAKDNGYRLGLATMKQQLMAKAVDAVVKIDAGGYPYVDRTIELYDYEQDIPLAKRGDKVKVIVIKEE
jgi:hypothetical protein